MAHARKPPFAFGPFVLDVSEQTLLRDGRVVPLTPKLFDVLRVLVEHDGRLVDKETFIAEVWGGGFVEEGALTRSVSMVRKALGDTLSDPVYIETVPKRGYRFIAPVTTQPALERSPGEKRIAWLSLAFLTVVVLAILALMARGADQRPLANSRPAPAHRQITFTGSADAPALSQDGERLAYVESDVAGEKRVVVRDLDGGNAIEIFRAPELGYVSWSPDDRHLLAWARGAGKNGVYVLSANGAAPRLIVPNRYVACWSPDGSTIAVPHYLGGEIALWTLAGEKQGAWSLGKLWSISDLDWSRATGRIAVVTNDQQGQYTIWTIQPDGLDQRKVLEHAGEITSVRWRPDGEALYYSHRRQQTVSINEVTMASSQPAAILTGLEAGRAFSISRDATRVVYARAPFHSNLWTMQLDTENPKGEPVARPLTTGTSYIERPRISPDGKQIVFTAGHEPQTQLYTMPIGGGPWTQLTNFNSTNVGGAWSPDGAQIAFVSTEGQKPQVWTIDARGGVPRRRSTTAVSDSFDLSWSSAGIAYQNPGNRSYTVLDVRTGEERPLVDDTVDGFPFSPLANPAGDVALFWNRDRRRGIWVIHPARRHSRLVYASDSGSFYPIGWSAANDAVFIVEGKPAAMREMTSRQGETMKEAAIVKVPVAGGEPRVVARIPFAEIGVVALSPDARMLVFPVFSSRSDIWLVDGFSEKDRTHP
ncbi:MAG: winged helix-turn-helix domain-containing protein [Vicinamibacterales bacterium]